MRFIFDVTAVTHVTAVSLFGNIKQASPKKQSLWYKIPKALQFH
jgi:hypothetical protein